MTTTTIEVPTADGVADCYLTRPPEVGSFPGVLLLMDIFGLRPQIQAMAERVAAHGYVVLSPNVFYRAGRAPVASLDGMEDPARRHEVLARMAPFLHVLTPEVVAADGAAYLDRLHEESDGGPAGIVGYCMGGRLGWDVAVAHPERVTALGAFHTGGLVSDESDSRHLQAPRLRAELYLGFADQDRSATPAQVAALERALDQAGVTYRSEVYAEALHGYTMADAPVFDAAASERHFAALLALLERRLR